ncbi:MAG: DTW domain-containing protein [Kiritimatiellae bacterium]|nr:DTW domain-containing protein [Kiritimatiellia bacterium]
MVDPLRQPLGSRRHRRPRCRVCGLHLDRCCCAELPRAGLPQRLILIQHAVEAERPTSTGRMAAHCWGNSEVLCYGRGRTPMDESPLCRPGWTYALLFPRADALTVADWRRAHEHADPARTAIVVPDGSWHQAAHMTRRLRSLRGMTCLRLPEGPPGFWRIRVPLTPDRLCTAEAVARLLAEFGHPAASKAMLDALHHMHEVMWSMRGWTPGDFNRTEASA